MPTSKIAVLGIWHLGSVYSACLAQLGYEVAGWDSDSIKVQQLNEGTFPSAAGGEKGFRIYCEPLHQPIC